MYTRDFYVGVDKLQPGVVEGKHNRGVRGKNLLTDGSSGYVLIGSGFMVFHANPKWRSRPRMITGICEWNELNKGKPPSFDSRAPRKLEPTTQERSEKQEGMYLARWLI
jgi:hypothetical protein